MAIFEITTDFRVRNGDATVKLMSPLMAWDIGLILDFLITKTLPVCDSLTRIKVCYLPKDEMIFYLLQD